MNKVRRTRTLGLREPSAKRSALHSGYRHGVDDRGLPTDYPTLLPVMLELAVPLEIARLRRRGGPSDGDWHRVREFGQRLAEHGDALLFVTTKDEADATTRKLERMAAAAEEQAATAACRGDEQALRAHSLEAERLRRDAREHEHCDTTSMFAAIARAIAVLAFSEGGIEFAGRRWRVENFYLEPDVPATYRPVCASAGCRHEAPYIFLCETCGLGTCRGHRQICCGEWSV